MKKLYGESAMAMASELAEIQFQIQELETKISSGTITRSERNKLTELRRVRNHYTDKEIDNLPLDSAA